MLDFAPDGHSECAAESELMMLLLVLRFALLWLLFHCGSGGVKLVIQIPLHRIIIRRCRALQIKLHPRSEFLEDDSKMRQTVALWLMSC